MRHAIGLAPAGPAGDPRSLAELAQLAEQSGWDGVFLEDYVVYQGQLGTPTYDPWVALSAIAIATRRVRLGTLVTPLPRRRPWKLASEAVTLDHLSRGRLVLGLGAGDARDASFARTGDAASQRVLAERLDEGLEILSLLWSGEEVSYHGEHYRLDGLRLAPAPLQAPRIPIWIGGDWLLEGVRRRLPRWDGCCVYAGTPNTAKSRPMTPEDVRELRAGVGREQFDVCVGGTQRGPDWDRERDHIRAMEDAGATWWLEWLPPSDMSRTREVVERGPLRVG